MSSPWLPAESQVKTANSSCKTLSTQENANLIRRLLINGLLGLTDEFDLSQDELKPFSGEQSVRSVVDVAGPTLWREDEAVFFYLLWLKTHLNILEKQNKVDAN